MKKTTKPSREFYLDKERFIIEDNNLLFLDQRHPIKDIQNSESKLTKISDSFQKQLIANYALGNYQDFRWIVEGDNISLFPHQVYYANKETIVWSGQGPAELLDIIINHWTEDWYIRYDKKDEFEYRHNEGKPVFVRLIPESQKRGWEKYKTEESKKLSYFQEELRKQDDIPLFLDKTISNGSMIRGICILDFRGGAILGKGIDSRTQYRQYTCMDQYLVTNAYLEDTKGKLFPGIYRVTCKVVDPSKNKQRSKYQSERIYLEIIEAHLIKKLQLYQSEYDRQLDQDLHSIEDYKFDLTSRINILKNTFTSMEYRFKRVFRESIKNFFYQIIIWIIFISGILAIWNNLSILSSILELAKNYFHF
jgi:hypothetical protein